MEGIPCLGLTFTYTGRYVFNAYLKNGRHSVHGFNIHLYRVLRI